MTIPALPSVPYRVTLFGVRAHGSLVISFVVWGAFHGVLITVSHYLGELKGLATFNHSLDALLGGLVRSDLEDPDRSQRCRAPLADPGDREDAQ